MKLTVLALVPFVAGVVGGACVNVALRPSPPRGAGGTSAMSPELDARVAELKRRLAVIEWEREEKASNEPVGREPGNGDPAEGVEPTAASADAGTEDGCRCVDLGCRGIDPVENAWRAELASWLSRILVTGTVESRRAAIARLVQLGGDEAAESIVAALSDPDRQVREHAVRYFATGYHHEVPDAGSLLRLLDDPSPRVAEWAARVVGRVRPEWGQPDHDHNALSLIASMEQYYLRSRKPANAFAVGCELQRLGRLDAVAGGMSRWRMLLNSPDAETRRIAVVAVGKFGTPADAACVRVLLEDPDEDVRDEARGSLDRLEGN